MTFRFTLYLALLGAAVPSFAEIHTDKVSVEMTVPDDVLAEQPPERRAAIENLRADVRAHLWRWTDVRVDLPDTAFEKGAVLVRQSDLFRTPDDAELRQLTTSPGGERVPLSDEHLKSIRQTGLIIVPSVKYPGTNHVWRFHQFWQKGRQNIDATFDRARGLALNQITVQIPERLKPDGDLPNLGHGVDNLLEGLRESVATMVGLIDEVPRYTDDDVTRILAEEAHAYVREKSAGRLDLRLYDDKVMKDVRPVVQQIENRFGAEWPRTQEDLLVPQLKVFAERGLKGEDLALTARAWLSDRRVELFHHALLENKELERTSPGIAKLIVDRDRAVRLTERAGRAIDADVETERARLVTEYRANHRVKQYLPEVMNRRIEPAVEAFRRARRERGFADLVRDLNAQDLTAEAELATLHLAFRTERANARRAEFAAELIPNQSVPVNIRIWNSANWIKTKREANGNTWYTAETDRVRRADSSLPLWRMGLIWERTHQAALNQNFYLWQALKKHTQMTFAKEAFHFKERLNRETGAVEPDPQSLTGTWATRQAEITRARHAANDHFDAQDEGDVIPKRVLRPAYRTRNALLAAGASAGLAVGEVGRFACVGLVSCVGMAASPFTSPVYAVGHWLTDALFYDSVEYARGGRAPLAPLVMNGVVSVVGAGEALAAVAAVPLHVVASGALYAGGATEYGVRRAWDAFWFSVIRGFNLPTKDKGVATERIRGPGLEQNIEFKIQPALALAALRAKLESMELSLLLARTMSTINQPPVVAAKQLEVYRKLGWQPNGAWLDEIRESSERIARRVQGEFRERQKSLPVINGQTGTLVRLRTSDLAPTLAAGTEITREFWQSRSEKLDWAGLSLVEGDYASLTEWIFTNVFGAGFLSPQPAADDTLVLEQQTPDFARAFDDVVNDRKIDPADVQIMIDRELASKLAPDVDPRRFDHGLSWSLDRTCEDLLFGH